jgi:hypothetical protein
VSRSPCRPGGIKPALLFGALTLLLMSAGCDEPPSASSASPSPATGKAVAPANQSPSAPPSPSPAPSAVVASLSPRQSSPPPPPPPQPPPQPASTCGAPANPWGYNFCGGNTIALPAPEFCNYFNCIANFWNGRGYVMQCADGAFSKSGGVQGSCSYHGGNSRPLYGP